MAQHSGTVIVRNITI